MKLSFKVIGCSAVVGLAVVATSAMAATQPHVSPFQDNITVNLSGTPALALSYAGDNGVNVSGPGFIDAGASSFAIAISSKNFIENGFPSMNVQLSDGSSCNLKFVDGPYTYLNFQSGNPPVCSHLSVSTIEQDDEYQYKMTLTYK